MVFTPKDAAVGSAKLYISLDENTKTSIAKILPLECDVTITDEKVEATEDELKSWKKMGWDINASKEENEKRIKAYRKRRYEEYLRKKGKK